MTVQLTFQVKVNGNLFPDDYHYELVTKQYEVNDMWQAFELAVKDGADPEKTMRWK